MKYLLQRHSEEIPESAAKLYERSDTLWAHNNSLDVTVKWYNHVRQNTLEVEFPLIEGQLADIDQQLEKAESSLTWNSDGLDEYIAATCEMVRHSVHA